MRGVRLCCVCLWYMAKLLSVYLVDGRGYAYGYRHESVKLQDRLNNVNSSVV